MLALRLTNGLALVRFEVHAQSQRVTGVYAQRWNPTLRRWLVAAATDTLARAAAECWKRAPRSQWELRVRCEDGLLRFIVQPASDEPGWRQRFVSRGPLLPARKIARALVDRWGPAQF